jgi:hypothetical protein
VAHDDWRIRIELEDQVDTLVERLGFDLHDEARELARELADDRLVVSRDGDTVFVYSDSAAQAERARLVIESELADEGLRAREIRLEHWLSGEDRWDNEPGTPTWEESLLARDIAPWEVRVECESHDEAEALADRLESEGYGVLRRWRFVIVGAGSEDEARELASSLHGEAEPSSELIWEVMRGNPFAVFGGLGG